jgi:hypothetical protein
MKRPLRDTKALSKYLKEQHGVDRSPAYLRKLRCTGGGPRFRRFNGKPYYEDDEADEWVEQNLSPPMSSTSEAEASGAQSRKRRPAEAEALVASIEDHIVDDLLDTIPDKGPATRRGRRARPPDVVAR